MAETEKSDDVSESPDEVRPTTTETPCAVEPAPDVYPIRAPSEDPRWALWVVGTWLVVALGLFLFIVVLLVLGIWYD